MNCAICCDLETIRSLDGALCNSHGSAPRVPKLQLQLPDGRPRGTQAAKAAIEDCPSACSLAEAQFVLRHVNQNADCRRHMHTAILYAFVLFVCFSCQGPSEAALDSKYTCPVRSIKLRSSRNSTGWVKLWSNFPRDPEASLPS